jgi:glycosyltransferase involved in cell wall biosynthesis
MIVTIVTPTFNAVEYLQECIESATRNASPTMEVEHVIVDGGSTDGTVELAESYGLRVIKGKDKGIFDAINKGSFDSAGELLGFLGADDRLLDGGLEAIVTAYRQSGRRWIVGGIQWIDEHGHDLGELAAPPTWIVARMLACLDWNPVSHMGTYMTRDFFTELGGFNIDFKDAGDFDLFTRALSKAPFERVATPVACFRRTGSNNSVVSVVRSMREVESVCDAFGPTSRIERVLWRYVLKAWINVTNPGWSSRKLVDRTLFHLGRQEKTHF